MNVLVINCGSSSLKYQVIDTETKEVLLTNDDIQSSETLRSSTSSGVSIYFAIELITGICSGFVQQVAICQRYPFSG